MSMIVNHNLPALSTYNVVNATSNALQKSINKLSTGLRINSAADDAAGLAISEKMRAQVRGLDQAVGNAQDGISMIQTAEGALNETHSILQRMRELSVQAANDTLTNNDRGYIQEEVDQLREEITRIGNTTQFNTKKLLNGDAAVLWSSSDSETKALVKGGLRNIDQFGQKKSIEGNYKITVKAEPGKGEIQKSDIFTVKHANTIDLTYKDDSLDDVSVDNIKTSVGDSRITYTLSGTGAQSVSGAVLGTSLGTTTAAKNWAAAVFTGADAGMWSGGVAGMTGANVEVVVKLKNYSTGVAGVTGSYASVDLSIQGRITYADGSSEEIAEFDQSFIAGTSGAAGFSSSAAVIGSEGGKLEGLVLSLTSANGLTEVWNNGAGKNSMAILRINSGDDTVSDPNTDSPDVQIRVKGMYEQDNGDMMSVSNTTTGGNNGTHSYNLKSADIAGKDIALKQYYFKDGTLQTGSVKLDVDKTAVAADLQKPLLAKFTAMEIGDTATGNVKLRDLDKFWDSEGNFMLEDPQTITITQGDGKSASVTLYAYDTLNDVAEKFNNAIAKDLGQADYISTTDTAGANKFATFVTDATANTSESVQGTFLIRSIIPGSNGTISFAGDEGVINAFSLNTIQDAKESEYTVSVQDAHTGDTVVEATKITGNVLYGKLHENVDVEFDALAGTKVSWNDTAKSFEYEVDGVDNTNDTYTTTLHLSDNTTVFQIGANEGEDMGINIGDMRAHALGLDEVNVSTRGRAARSITVIDNAIDKVSMQRSKLGAYQNRLEHTVNNLTTSSENLTAAESRIRDTDMAKEMLNFSKLQIMLQAGNSMLAQANQLPQNVLSIIR